MSKIPEDLITGCDYDKKNDLIIFECRVNAKSLECCFSQDVLEQIKPQYFTAPPCRKAIC